MKRVAARLSAQWILILLLNVLWAGSAASHPSQFHTAAHDTKVYINGQGLTLEYQVKIPKTFAAQTTASLIEEDILNGWIVEINGKEVRWNTKSPLQIVPQHQSVVATFSLDTSLYVWPAKVRLSNGNLSLTRGFYSNSLFISPDIQIIEATPPSVNTAGQKANLTGSWTMDSASRTWLLTIDKQHSILERINDWVVQTPRWRLAKKRHYTSILDAWKKGSKGLIYTVFLTLLTVFISVFLNYTAKPHQRTSMGLFFPYCVCIVLMWVLPASGPLWPIIGLILLLSSTLVTFIRWPISALALPILSIIGIAFSYDAPRLALVGLITSMAMSCHSGFMWRSTINWRPYRLIRVLLGITSIFVIWRVL